jgi:hypothetical protein
MAAQSEKIAANAQRSAHSAAAGMNLFKMFDTCLNSLYRDNILNTHSSQPGNGGESAVGALFFNSTISNAALPQPQT